jgi:hypothetical protein
MNLQKFRAPVFSRQPGGKENDHSAASGWLTRVVNAVRVGTAPAIRAARTIAYHGVLPRLENDMTKPIEARPSSAETISEPVDVPGADDMVRKIKGAPEIHPAFTRASKRIF